jgi:uncharacterized protein YqhQ
MKTNQVFLIIACIVFAYVLFHIKKFSSSPMGKAISSVMGEAEKVLTSIASLPPWVLIGIGSAYLFGDAVLKMSGSDVMKLARSSNSINESLTTMENAEDIATVAASKLNVNLRTNIANSEQSPETQQLRQSAEESHAEVINEFPEYIVETAESLADEAIPIEE